MISELELWACAQHVVRLHGSDSRRFLTERVSELARKGDQCGVDTWMAIAARVDELTDCEGIWKSRH
ncbi:DUF6961 family protein [Sphingomonas sp.]|uniref:DUF6961 family protein n=1 Tax=Sphingomonas sp. TaxID=28214 RepID=UPI003B3ADB42